MSHPQRSSLTFPSSHHTSLAPYLPSSSLPTNTNPRPPHLTLTFATSLDSSLSLSPGTQTALSGPLSKSMTHHLRSVHDAILIGVGTAVCDDPSLNCRIEGVGGYGGEGLQGQPRPVVLDPRGRWDVRAESKCVGLAREGRGRAPWVLVGEGVEVDVGRKRVLESVGGKYVRVKGRQGDGRMGWEDILQVLGEEGIASVMVEGGGSVINELLSPPCFHLVSTVILTIAPTWLGQRGVQVCPEPRVENGTRVSVGRLKDVKWIPLDEDVVLCGRPKDV